MIAPAPAQIEALVRTAALHSDQGEAGLAAWAAAFVRAHCAAPGGLSIEVGSREGGGTLLFLKLIELLYPEEIDRPLLVSIDPYGFKPPDHAPVGPVFGFYGHGAYIAQRKLLAEFPNHAHFLLRSTDFFDRLEGVPYWIPSSTFLPTRLTAVEGGKVVDGAWAMAPVGAARNFGEGDTTFALLDGDHAEATIREELAYLWGDRTRSRWMRPGGLVVVDDVDHDPTTWKTIYSNYAAVQVTSRAIVTGRL